MGYTVWWTNSLLLNMAIEIVDFPIKKGGSFHCYVKLPEGTAGYNQGHGCRSCTGSTNYEIHRSTVSVVKLQSLKSDDDDDDDDDEFGVKREIHQHIHPPVH